jgi:hypothetical protein
MKSLELKKLRGSHDQTMRCGIVEVICGDQRIDGKTPTDRFLELMIMQAEVYERCAVMDEAVEDD